MISDPVAQVTESGVTAPTFEEILEFYTNKFQSIFGSDIDLDADTQDGQLCAIFASALNDVNASIVSTASAYNPQTAYGVALDSAVKTNGISRRAATYSTADVTLTGTYGTVIANGQVKDDAGNLWDLPSSVTIGSDGTVTVTATCETAGAIEAEADTITSIATPTLGWTSVTNASAATVGANSETDAELRKQQSESTMQPSLSLWEGLVGSVEAINDVVSVSGINNDTASTDADGIPAHTIAIVVYGGDADEIAETIFKEKSPGVATFGSTSVTYTDSFGNANIINFTRTTLVPITVEVTITQNQGYTSEEVTLIQNRIANYINGLGIGADVNISRVLSNAIKTDEGLVDTLFDVVSIELNGSASSVAIDWDEMPTCDPDDVTVTGA